MISCQEAERILLAHPLTPRKERQPLAHCLGRILAADVSAPLDIPPFDKSAMDGYAVSAADPGESFQVVAVVAAGDVPRRTLQAGECAKVMTGAMLPQNTGRVVKREVCREENGRMHIVAFDPNPNILRCGEDIRQGQIVLRRGNCLRAAQISLLASLGLAETEVFVRPRVGVITTGTELLEPGTPWKPGQIFNSNIYSLTAQIRPICGEPQHLGSVPDRRGDIRSAIQTLGETCDLIILSGGVSAGDFDFVPQVLAEMGIAIHFAKVAVQPGMPTVFGSWGEKIYFGLPGNPVSTYVIFDVFIKPFLYRMMGHSFQPLIVKARLGEFYERRKGERTAYVPVSLQGEEACLLPYHGSAHLLALTQADGLLAIPAGILRLERGAAVDVRLL